MITSRSYPLEALITLRQGVKERWERRLAQGLEHLRQAEALVKDEEQRLQEHTNQLDLRRQQVTAQHTLSIAELQGQDRYIARLQEELAILRQAHQEARRARDERKEALAQIKQKLTQAEAQLQVVQKNFAVWDRSRQQAEHKRAELELEDLLAAKR